MTHRVWLILLAGVFGSGCEPAVRPIDAVSTWSGQSQLAPPVRRIHLESYHPHPILASVLEIRSDGHVCERAYYANVADAWVVREFEISTTEFEKLSWPFRKVALRSIPRTSIDRLDHYRSLLRVETNTSDVHEWRFAEPPHSTVQTFLDSVSDFRFGVRETGRPGVRIRRRPVTGEIRLLPRPEGEGLEPCLLPEWQREVR